MFTLSEAHVLFLLMVFVTVVLAIVALGIYKMICIAREIFDNLNTKINYDETVTKEW